MKIGHKENIKLKLKSLSNCSLYAFQRQPLEPSAKGLLLGSEEPVTKIGKRKRLSLFSILGSFYE